MTLTIDLPAAEEAALRERAERAGVALDAWVLEVLRREVLPVDAMNNTHAGGVVRHRPRTAVEILAAPPEVREAALEESARVAAEYYASPAGEAELTDWRALDGEDFHGFEDALEEERHAA